MQLECEQIYAKVLGADDEETLDAAMRALTVGEEKEEEQGEEGDDDDAFYLFLQKQKIALEPYTLPPGTPHHKKRKHTQ